MAPLKEKSTVIDTGKRTVSQYDNGVATGS